MTCGIIRSQTIASKRSPARKRATAASADVSRVTSCSADSTVAMILTMMGSSSITRTDPRLAVGGPSCRASLWSSCASPDRPQHDSRSRPPPRWALLLQMRPPGDVTIAWQTERPSPVPEPTALVVKNGSKIRGNSSGEIPAPSRWTSMWTTPGPGRVTTRISCCSAAPSGMACAALRRRLMNTWLRRPGSALTLATGARSRTSLARWRISLCAIARETSSASRTSTGRKGCSSTRERALSSRTMVRTLSAPVSASRRVLLYPLDRASRGAEPRRAATSSRMSSRLPSTNESGLFTSCATPAATIPSDARRSARAWKLSLHVLICR